MGACLTVKTRMFIMDLMAQQLEMQSATNTDAFPIQKRDAVSNFSECGAGGNPTSVETCGNAIHSIPRSQLQLLLRITTLLETST